MGSQTRGKREKGKEEKTWIRNEESPVNRLEQRRKRKGKREEEEEIKVKRDKRRKLKETGKKGINESMKNYKN